MLCLPSRQLNLLQWCHLLGNLHCDVPCLNSFFDWFSVQMFFLLRWGLLNVRPVTLAIRSEFFPGTLPLKDSKECTYTRLARRMGLWKDVIWLGSSDGLGSCWDLQGSLAGLSIAAQPSVLNDPLPQRSDQPQTGSAALILGVLKCVSFASLVTTNRRTCTAGRCVVSQHYAKA